MRALVVADLHLDMWRDEPIVHPLNQIEPAELENLDLVIVAGALINRGQERWRRALIWLGERVDVSKVHVFPGNHDFYGGELDREDKLKAQCEAAGAHWAQKSEIILGGRRFVCCSLWTDMAWGGGPEVNAWHAERVMNDYRAVRVEADSYRRARAADTVAIHRDHRAWLADRLAIPFDGETIVVTHHAPHPECNGEEFAGSTIAAAYVSDLTAMIEEHRPAAWLYGHTHVPLRFTLGSTLIMNVSVGYPPSLDLGRPVGDPRHGILEW